jgi:hypothetical protein
MAGLAKVDVDYSERCGALVRERAREREGADGKKPLRRREECTT